MGFLGGIIKKNRIADAIVTENSKKYIAEFLGTFGIVFFGTGAVIVNELSGGAISNIGISITFGLIVATMIYSFAELSGAHFNPAVTIALIFKSDMPLKQLAGYLISQVIGGVSASYTLHLLFPANLKLGATIPAGSQPQSFVLEFLLTFFLMLVILQTTHYDFSKSLAGLLIGAVVLFEAMFGGPISGASMNPARSIGPAVVSGNFTSLWIYLLAPVLGAISALVVSSILTDSSLNTVQSDDSE